MDSHKATPESTILVTVDTQPGSKSAGYSKERKPTALSCAECRRSKLKCDRVFPCQACVRRGCAALCPDGVLNATKGNKVLQVRVDKLNEEVASMSSKIKELESALAAARLQLSASTEPSEEIDGREPGNQRSLRCRPYGVGSGTLAMDGEGVSSFHGETAQSEYLSELIPGDGLASVYCPPDIMDLGLPHEVLELFNAFPFGMRKRIHNKSLFVRFLPSAQRALSLTESYYRRHAWMSSVITRKDFTEQILHRIYASSEIPTIDQIHPHRLAVFFAVVAIGASLNPEPAADQQGGKYYVLACAALSLVPIIAEAMVPTIQAIFMINSFLHNNNRVSAEESWLLTGLVGRLAFRIGLHRDGDLFKLDKEEVQRRRILFWEMYVWDAWFSFVTGRPPSMHLPDSDTKFPEEFDDSGLPEFHSWKYRYAAACLWPSIRLCCARCNTYKAVMNLDKKIRMFPVPAHLHPPVQGLENRTWSDDIASAMQQYCVVWGKELTLMFIHRNYLAVTLRASPRNPISHKYGGSVMAAFRSIARLCHALRQIYALHPEVVSRVWFYWSGIFSACIFFAAVVIMCPMCSLAEVSLKELRSVTGLFEEGSKPCRHPKSLCILKTVLRQAEESYATYLADPSKPSGVEASEFDTPDELKILGGVLNGVVKHPTAPQSATFSLGNVVSSFSDIGAPFSFGDFAFHPSPTLTDDDVTAPINFAEFASIFNPSLNDTQCPDISSTLPTYEDIMNVHYGPDATANLNLDQSYPSFTQPLHAPGRYNISSFPTNASLVGALERNAGNPTASFSGDSHDEIWRSLFGGLSSNGSIGGNALYEQHLF